MARICIIGSGAVGTAAGTGFKELGSEVVFYDVDRARIQTLSDLNLDATTDLDLAVRSSDFSFICVPTPTKNGTIDLGFVKSASEAIARSLRDKRTYHVVVVRTTVIPTSTEKVVIPTLREISGRKIGQDVGVCVNPDFSTEVGRSRMNDFLKQERVVIGELDKNSGDALQALYQTLRCPIVRTDLRTAEMIKYASNCALAARISYWNEIYYVCQYLGIDSDAVARVAAMDSRIGQYGTATGKAFGGKCLPKDLEAFVGFCEELRCETKLMKAVMEVNERIRVDKGVRE